MTPAPSYDWSTDPYYLLWKGRHDFADTFQKEWWFEGVEQCCEEDCCENHKNLIVFVSNNKTQRHVRKLFKRGWGKYTIRVEIKKK